MIKGVPKDPNSESAFPEKQTNKQKQNKTKQNKTNKKKNKNTLKH